MSAALLWLFFGRFVKSDKSKRVRMVLSLSGFCVFDRTYLTQIWSTLFIMCLVANASIWILSSLVALATATPSCNLIYGRPNGDYCRRLLVGFTRVGPPSDRGRVECFAPAGSAQPDDVGPLEWAARVDIPKFWYSGKCYHTSLGCDQVLHRSIFWLQNSFVLDFEFH